jgi:hypothetical protein
MKTKIAIITFLSLLLSAAASPEHEADFKTRFEKFVAEKDAALISTFWQQDESPLSTFFEFKSKFQIAAFAGVSEISFRDIEPEFREYLKKATPKDGKYYILSGTPYKLVEIKLKDTLKNDVFTGFGMITGFKDGKLYILGLHKTEEPK